MSKWSVDELVDKRLWLAWKVLRQYQAIYNESLPADLFTVRARVLLGKARREDAASWASGLLIGTDVRIGLTTPTAAEIVIMGRPELTSLYAAAIDQAGRPAIEIDGEECFLAGIHEIAKRIDK